MKTLINLPFANRRTFEKVAVALALACAALTTVPAMAASPHLRIASSEIGRTQHIEVGVNKSVIVDLPVEAGEVIVSQPGVANAIMRTRSRAIIQGMAPGETNIFFLDPAGAGIAVIEISVAQDSTGLAATINRLIPGARVSVESLADSVVLSGNVNSGADLEKAIEIASQYVGGAGVTSVIEVAGGQQIALKVTVAEIQRETARQLGIDLSASVAMSSSQIGLAGPTSSVDAGAGNYSFGLSVPNVEIEAALRALESQNAVRLLAEPVLTAMSGQEATFHVGGEFPVETRDADGNPTVTYKPYGIQLAFTPTVQSNGQVGLVLDTEVSEPQLDNTLNIRSATTSVELGTNQTLAIAGLIDERMRRQLSSLPGLGNIPILGALFRSYEYVSEQTELVILVTPMIAQPTPSYARAPLPTDTYQPASDAESMFLGRMESLYGVTGGGGAGEFRGSVGFVLD
ncbi:type II and III secretion system protein family protein [Pelagibacterium xiamenense]|uniref:type II and III secretion system protein family protein n=1 Tax=Pelagibacterium xiamenense TaxID=2901140 RepID=UPI001E610D0B|nr:type II and III secretion system protein family protein [Pelagibacterium xiamenense]MCD7058871.1 type II and III secretion system protein family protein [Pelagibacterium xiamenense]